jgi:hypothetical protein
VFRYFARYTSSWRSAVESGRAFEQHVKGQKMSKKGTMISAEDVSKINPAAPAEDRVETEEMTELMKAHLDEAAGSGHNSWSQYN